MNPVAAITLSRLQTLGYNFPNYSEWLVAACDIHPPPYGAQWYGLLYRDLAHDPVWFANSLLVNAEKEGVGSRRIWDFSRLVEDARAAASIQKHSIDESRHSRMFVKIVDYVFEAALTDELRQEYFRLSPGYTRSTNPGNSRSAKDLLLSATETIDEIIQVNLVEIRSLILQLLLRPVVLAYAPSSAQTKITRMLNGLVRDEIQHIAYSAGILETEVARGHAEFVRFSMISRQADLNSITCEEVAREQFNGCGECRACIPLPLLKPIQ